MHPMNYNSSGLITNANLNFDYSSMFDNIKGTNIGLMANALNSSDFDIVSGNGGIFKSNKDNDDSMLSSESNDAQNILSNFKSQGMKSLIMSEN
jgi:hypothetical protein